MTARVELYNDFERLPSDPAGRRVLRTAYGSPRFRNGWLVAEYTEDGRRGRTLARFGSDQDAAAAFAADVNKSKVIT